MPTPSPRKKNDKPYLMECETCRGTEWRASKQPYNCPWCGESPMTCAYDETDD